MKKLITICIVFHGLELMYLYPGVILPGFSTTFTPVPSTENLSTWMIDYWVSFATSLNPNDGKGSNRKKTYHLQSV